ncbi:hypothetical protein MRX96_059657 [Rhipicephalus microplus]
MAASRKGKQIDTRPITRTPSETATQTEVVRGLRLCHLRRWQNFKGYGFDVKVEEKGHAFMIHRVDIHSPAELGGLGKDDRLLEVNGTSVEGKTLLEVVDLIEEDPLKVDVLVIDKETEQEFVKRREVPSRKSPKLVYKTAPPEMPISPRQKKQAVSLTLSANLLAPPSGSARIVAIEKLSAKPSPPVPDKTGKPGNKGKPAKPVIPKVTAKLKAAAKGGTKANAAEVSKAEAKLMKKFALARAAENGDEDKGADDAEQQPNDSFEASEDDKPGQTRDRGVDNRYGISDNASSASAFSSNDWDEYGEHSWTTRGPTRLATTGPPNSIPGRLRSPPTYAPPLSLPGSPSYAPTIIPTSSYDAHSPMSSAGAYMPYSLPGSPFWSPPMLPGMLPYQTPYMPFVQMSGFYGFPYVSSTYPDFSAYVAPFSSYPYSPGGEANQYDDGAEEGANVSQHDAGSSRSHKEMKWSKDKPAKSKAKDQALPLAPHDDHKPDKTP